ncbi:MAG TPA: 2-C-methyl-D-erythritol 4-phosphate cytidylyltransferase [Pyrinomonadaceae bacterium]
MHVDAIVVAAGAGRRMGGATVKTYLPIAGRPLILRTLDRIVATPSVANVILVVAAADVGYCRDLLNSDGSLKGRAYIVLAGGPTRQESVRRGLEKIAAETDIVMIHDGARPFVSSALIERCLQAAASKGSAVPGLPVRDTIKRVGGDGYIQNTPERAGLWEIQTPQIFQRDLIVAAHQLAARDGIEASDDAMVVERMDKPVFVVEGDRNNFKITVPEDLPLAEALIRAGVVG